MKENPIYQFGQNFLFPLVKGYSRLKITGEASLPPAGQGALIACNHSGSIWWDALTLASALSDRQVQFIAHHWDATVPWIKKALDQLDTAFLDASLDKISPQSAIVKRLKLGEQMCIYPEESYHSFRHRYTLFRFSAQVIKYAELADVPIIPIAVIGAEEAAPTLFGLKKSSVPLHIPMHLPFILPVQITIDIGKPLYIKDLKAACKNTETDRVDYDMLAELVRQQLYVQIKKYRDCRLSNEKYIERRSWF